MPETEKRPFTLSVVTPVYQAEAFIAAFHQRMSDAARTLTPDYEIIFVNDGSTDQSLSRLLELRQSDPHTSVIDLSRNFGQHKAIHAGLSQATGDLVFVIDDDLEEQPEWLLQFHHAMHEQSADVVLAVQRARKGRPLERWSGELFYFLLKHLFRVDLLRNIVTARLMTRHYVDALLGHNEQDFELSVVGFFIGFKRAVVTVDKGSHGTSSYTLKGKIRFFENYMTSATTEPLRWIAPLGLLCIALGTCIGATALYGHAATYGLWLLASLWLLGGLILVSLGVTALYVTKIFHEVRGRPQTIARNVYSRLRR